MQNFNYSKTIVIGNLGADPEISYTAGGAGILKMSIGVNKNVNRQGENKTHTEWYKVVKINLSDAQAKFIKDTMRQGDTVFAEGEMETRKWNDNGKDRYMTELVAWTVRLVSKKGEKQGSKQDLAAQQYSIPDDGSDYPGDNPFDDMR